MITLTREEAQQVLDALENFCEHGAILKPLEVRELLRARLAQPEPEPVAWLDDEGFFWLKEECPDDHRLNKCKPLYTAPPQREWVGLTDEEIRKQQHHIDWTNAHTYAKYARAIEAKLKEKNT